VTVCKTAGRLDVYIFWWSGRGYVTILVILGTLTAFGLAAAAGVPDRPLLWAIALLVAAALNWHFGSRINRKKLAAAKPRSLRARLFYPARHRLMSLPMETFSIPLVICAAGVLIYGWGISG